MMPQIEGLELSETGPIWVSSFSDSGLKDFTKRFIDAEQNPEVGTIQIVISSYGGSAHNMMAMRDLIKSSNKQVATIAYGKAMSAGAFLLAAGSKGLRFASPSTSVMLHEVSSGTVGKLNDMQISIEETARMNKFVIGNFAEDTNKTPAFWETKMKSRSNGDLYLTPEDALKLGLVDHIGYPRLMQQEIRLSSQLVTFEKKPVQGPEKKSKKKK